MCSQGMPRRNSSQQRRRRSLRASGRRELPLVNASKQHAPFGQCVGSTKAVLDSRSRVHAQGGIDGSRDVDWGNRILDRIGSMVVRSAINGPARPAAARQRRSGVPAVYAW